MFPNKIYRYPHWISHKLQIHRKITDVSVNFLHHELSRLSSKSTCTPVKGLRFLIRANVPYSCSLFDTSQTNKRIRISSHLKYYFSENGNLSRWFIDSYISLHSPTYLSIKFTSISKFSMPGKNRAISRDLPFHNSRMRPISSLHVPPSVPAQHAFPFPFWSDEESSPSPSLSLFLSHEPTDYVKSVASVHHGG